MLAYSQVETSDYTDKALESNASAMSHTHTQSPQKPLGFRGLTRQKLPPCLQSQYPVLAVTLQAIWTLWGDD